MSSRVQRVTFLEDSSTALPKATHGFRAHQQPPPVKSRVDAESPATGRSSPDDYYGYVRSLERTPSAAPTTGPHFPNLQGLFNRRPNGGCAAVCEAAPAKQVPEEKAAAKSGDANSAKDTDGFAVEFLRKKHEFFERQKQLSMQMRSGGV